MALTDHLMTVDEFFVASARDPHPAQLIDGVMVVNNPKWLHQRACGLIYARLLAWCEGDGFGVPGLGMDMVLDRYNCFSPDVWWVVDSTDLEDVGIHRLPAVLGAADDGAVAADEHRALHEARVLDQEVGDGIGRRVVGGVEAQALEVRVLADEVGRRVLQLGHEVEQCRLVERLLQVLDDLGVGARRRELVEGVLRRGALGVVKDRDLGHVPTLRRPFGAARGRG